MQERLLVCLSLQKWLLLLPGIFGSKEMELFSKGLCPLSDLGEDDLSMMKSPCMCIE
jgi:hypothetical protein